VRRRALVREAARRRRVQARPLPRRQIGLDRRPDDGVDKAHRPTRLEDPGGGQLVGRGRGGAGVQPGQAGGQPEVRLAQHSRRRRQRAGRGSQAAQPPHHRLRDRARRERGDAGRGCRRRLDPRLGNRPDEFLDQERNAAGYLVTGRGERRRHVGPEP